MKKIKLAINFNKIKGKPAIIRIKLKILIKNLNAFIDKMKVYNKN